MNHEVLILSAALAGLCIGIALLVLDMVRRAQRRREAERPIDTSIFQLSAALNLTEPGETSPVPPALEPLPPLEDNPGFHRMAETELAAFEQSFGKSKRQPITYDEHGNVIESSPAAPEPDPATAPEPEAVAEPDHEPRSILHRGETEAEPTATAEPISILKPLPAEPDSPFAQVQPEAVFYQPAAASAFAPPSAPAPDPVPEFYTPDPAPEFYTPDPVPEFYAPDPVPEFYTPDPAPENVPPEPVLEIFLPESAPENFTPEPFAPEPETELSAPEPVPEPLAEAPVPAPDFAPEPQAGLPAEPAPEPTPEPEPSFAPEPAPLPTGPVLVCEGFGAGFGEKTVLADITLTIPAYGITTLMGPAGTGKSTLLRALAGVLNQSGLFKNWGAAYLRGQPLGAENRPLLVAQRIQLTQRPALDSLLFHRRDQFASLPPEEQRSWAAQWLAQAGAEQLIPQLDTPFMALDQLSQRIITILREAAAQPALLMIDEPATGLSDADANVLLSLLRRLAAFSPLLVVLQNQKHAKAISGQIILIAGGRVQAQCGADDFFNNPPNPAVAQFVATGSCAVPAPNAAPTPAPAPEPEPEPEPEPHAPPPLSADSLAAIKAEIRATLAPEMAPAATAEAAPAPEPEPVFTATLPAVQPETKLRERAAITRYPSAAGPRGFVWIEEGRLAATPMPGISADVDHDLSLLRNIGVNVLITLTEKNFPQDVLARHGLTNLHLPIADRKAPTTAETDMLVGQMRDMLAQGDVLAVHCLAGLGRTGTILAAYLVKEKGLSAQVALNQIRHFNRQFVQSDDQEDFLMEYEVQQEQTVLRNRAADGAKL